MWTPIIACALMIAVAVAAILLDRRTTADDVALARTMLASDRKYGHLAQEPVYDPDPEKREGITAMGLRGRPNRPRRGGGLAAINRRKKG